MSALLGAKPSVLRCSRCGKFVDWEDARLQVVDSCRSRIELPPVMVRPAREADQAPTLDLFRRDFGHTSLVAFGEVMVLENQPALVAEMKGELGGALAYRLLPDALHIVALATDPLWQRLGVGGHLVAEAELLARQRELDRVVLSTTNDNLPSLYFYQRRGYCITEVVPGALLPHGGGVGFAGIQPRDEIRLEKALR
jgi:ribosomal protein S18 acetylase RimI-like enzyme